MLEMLGYVAEDYDAELQKPSSELEATYVLPNGEEITISYERFKAIEPLFQPSLIGMDSKGIHELVYESIMKCDTDKQQALLANIVLIGAGTMFNKFESRMNKEMTELASTPINVIASDNRDNAVWIGGRDMAMAAAYQWIWITRDEYYESGPGVINGKVFAAQHNGDVNLLEELVEEIYHDPNDGEVAAMHRIILFFACIGMIASMVLIQWGIWKCCQLHNRKYSEQNSSRYDVVNDYI